MTFHPSYRLHALHLLLEKLPSAKRVTILTYSLDEDWKSPLLQGLRDLPDTARLTIVTNIPGRWASYDDAQAERMSKKFDAYLSNLAPGNFSCASEVCFSFRNHAKIFIVDDIAYVGSANFTRASAENFEAGVLLSKRSDLVEIEKFIKTVRSSSVPLLKAGKSKLAQSLLNLVSWTSDIIRSVREENGQILSEDEDWIEGDRAGKRSEIVISEKLSAFLNSCRTAAEKLRELCGTKLEVLNEDLLNEVLEFCRFFEEKDYNDMLPAPFSEARVSESLVEELLNVCSADGDVDEVIEHPQYQEKLQIAMAAGVKEADSAVSEALEDLAEYITITASKLRSSFVEEDVSPQIDNT